MSFNDLLSPKPYRWPKKGDLPFRKAVRSDVAGRLARDQLTRTVSIMDGFMLAGTALADQALQGRIHRYDLVYPMLFCYRHAIETGLKWLITQYGPRRDVMHECLDDTHDLVKLWNDCISLFRAYGTDGNDVAIEAVGKIVKQFHDWDKRGVAFRYATKKNGALVAFKHPDIDISHLKDVMTGVANFFSGSDGWLNDIANV